MLYGLGVVSMAVIEKCFVRAMTKSVKCIVQEVSLARRPKLLSIKNYVIEKNDLKIYVHIPGTMQNRTCS